MKTRTIKRATTATTRNSTRLHRSLVLRAIGASFAKGPGEASHRHKNKTKKTIINIIKIKIHSSGCEIEYFVETHLCKLCVILRSRVLRVVCPHQGYRSATPLATTV